MSTAKSQIFNQAADLSPKPHSGAQDCRFFPSLSMDFASFKTNERRLERSAGSPSSRGVTQYPTREQHHYSYLPSDATTMQLPLANALLTLVKVECIAKVPVFHTLLLNSDSEDCSKNPKAEIYHQLHC